MAEASRKPIIAGVTTLSNFCDVHFGHHDDFKQGRFRLAAELRLDHAADWRKVLDSKQWFADQLAHVKDWWGLKKDRLFIATCRRKEDGGQFEGTERERLRVLEHVAEHADFVDMEMNVSADVPAGKVIRSHHNTRNVPDFGAIADIMLGQPHAIIKIVGTAPSLAANLTVRDFLRDFPGPAGAVLMGPYGVPSRAMAHAWGSALSYHSKGNTPYAEGMLTLSRFIGRYRGHRLGERTRVFGVTGTQVEHSRSPSIHNSWLEKSEPTSVYLPLKAVDFEDFQAFALGLPLAGASVTSPFKQDAYRACFKVDPSARRAESCNTILVKRGRLHGCNTDTPGFMADLRSRLNRPLQGLRALVLGAGGGARAVIAGLARNGCAVEVWARKGHKARNAARSLGAREWREGLSGAFELLINTTPCGMAGEHERETPLTWARIQRALEPRALVYDLVYSPPRTPLLYAAERAGMSVANGWGMLQEQARLQAKLFGYRPAPRAKTFVGGYDHIWLIGPRASGKSTLAPILAEKLGYVATDTDMLVEQKTRRTVIEYFKFMGSAAYRAAEAEMVELLGVNRKPTKQERRAAFDQAVGPLVTSPELWRTLREAAEKPGPEDVDGLPPLMLQALNISHKVIATGGGIVENQDNVNHMRTFGVVVYLDAPEDLLVERLKRDPGGRPSLTGKPVHEEVHEILARRRPLYEAAAHITIRADRPPPVLAGEIIDRLAQFEP